VSGCIAQLFLNLDTRGGGGWCGQHHVPAAFTPGKDPVPFVQEAGWAPEPVWIGAENLAPPGFDPRTFQPVASRYTDLAIAAFAKILIFKISYDLKEIKTVADKILAYVFPLPVSIYLLLFCGKFA
jgi:hypothetical protein